MMVGGLPLRRAFARASAKGGVLMQIVLLKEDTLFDFYHRCYSFGAMCFSKHNRSDA